MILALSSKRASTQHSVQGPSTNSSLLRHASQFAVQNRPVKSIYGGITIRGVARK